MTIIDVVKSLKPFKRPNWDYCSCYYLSGTGPNTELVDCDYFSHSGVFSTSIDLYPEDILANDYYLVESIPKL